MSDPQRGATSPFLCLGRHATSRIRCLCPHAKRAAMIAQTEFWLAVSQDEKARPDGAPRPPDPWDAAISKRQWEKDFCAWRHALRQWRSVNPVEIDVEYWNNCDPDDETEYYAQLAILRYEAELQAELLAEAQAAASQGPAPVASSSGAAASSSGGEPAASQRRSVPPYKAQPWPTSPSAPPRERWSWFWDERRQKWNWYWTE